MIFGYPNPNYHIDLSAEKTHFSRVIDVTVPKNIGKYLIRERIGQGGMGVVYRAIDSTLDRQVAIKVIQTARLSRTEQLTRFTTEAKALAQLSSPHVVSVFDYHPDPQEPYLVMEFVSGRSLATVLRQEGAVPVRKLIDCAWQVLSGLSAAHAAGILHRDIKPGNILLANNGVYKLADFGLALDNSSNNDLTNTGEIVGTIRYLAPERASGGEATVLSDIYGVGISLYELACGQHPIKKEDNPLAIANRIVKEPIPSIRVALPNFPAALAVWFDRMLAHDPTQRFSSAQEAITALERIDIVSQKSSVETTKRVAKKIIAKPSAKTDDDVTKSTVVTNNAPSSAPTVPFTLPKETTSGRPLVSGTSRPPSTAIHLSATGLRSVPEHLQKKPKTRFVAKLIIVIWLLSSGATFIAGLTISRQAISEQTEHFRKELANTAAGASLFIDGTLHKELAEAGVAAQTHPGFEKLRSTLQRYRKTHPDITYIYTMTKLPDTDKTGLVAFVCDASNEIDRNKNGIIDPDEVLADPGQRYDASDAPQLLAGFLDPTADHEFVHDQWGSWLSGYAPITDEQGNVTGIVGVDLAAAHISKLERDFLFHSMVLLLSTLVAFLAAGVLVAFRMRRPIVALHDGLLKVARGDLDVQVKVETADEFKTLADSFNYMIAELKEAATVRKSFEGFVADALSTHGIRSISLPTKQDGIRARLYCDLDQGDFTVIDRQAFSVMLNKLLPLLFDAVRLHDGVPERVLDSGVIVSFPALRPNDVPQERAVRAALAFLAAVEDVSPTTKISIGIDVGESGSSVEEHAIALSHANARLGTDLLVSSSAFISIRNGFFADRLKLEVPPNTEAYAIKGAVSA